MNTAPPATRPRERRSLVRRSLARGPAAPRLHALWPRMAVAGSRRPSRQLAAAAVVRAASVAQQLVGDARRDGVYGVVEGVDRDLLRRPEDGRWGDVQRGQGDLRAPPYSGAVGDRRGARREADGIKQPAHHSPAGAVAPVRKVIETRAGDVIGEGRDPQRFGRRTRWRRTRLAVPQPRLESTRDRHCRGPGEAGHQPLADAAGQLLSDSHESTSWSCPPDAGLPAVLTCAPSRSSKWSPTRSAFAIAVSAGFTALLDGKKLVSTT